MAVLCHGLFNALAAMGLLGFALLSFVLIPVLWKLVNRGIKRSLAASPHARTATTLSQPVTGIGGDLSVAISDAGAGWGEGATKARSEYHWKRPALNRVLIFVTISILLAHVVPKSISAQRHGREKTMASRLQIATRAAEDYAREHEGYYPTAGSGSRAGSLRTGGRVRSVG